MSQKYEKLKTLLQELFQLDQPDLDFGLYRVMHAKSAEVSQFLDKDLLPQVHAAFGQYKTADKAEIEKELSKVIASIEAADMDPAQSPKVKDLRERIKSDAVDLGALESEVYDHLFSFFRRYYSEGDFLAKRVYKPGVYAIPYEGEEVTLHWANKDQYYIKTAEYLRDYAFRPGSAGVSPAGDRDGRVPRVHFRLADAAEGEHGNVKAAEGKDRVFILAALGDSGRDFIALESPSPLAGEGRGEGEELVIRFEYRPATLTDWPEDVRAGKSKPPAQKDLISLAVKRIFSYSSSPLAEEGRREGASLAPWIAELSRPHVTAAGEKADYTRLEAHLKRYTARNTFDYFIHKDLGTFLRRELDFYIKNEVMHLDDVENESALRVEQYLSKIKVIRKIAGKIIAFLAQIEDFQKKLWLKKKFVVETQYCITVGCIPEAFYAEIAANEAQHEEWIKLYAIDEIKSDLMAPGYSKKLKPEFLKAHPTLMVDTHHFNADFIARLLEAMGDVDEQMDGLLVHSENFQALGLLTARLSGRIDVTYIDPPYNTQDNGFAYKNGYKHSSWASMMQMTLVQLPDLLVPQGVAMVAIDDTETGTLRRLMDDAFGASNFAGTVAIEVNPAGQNIRDNVPARSHDYCHMYARDIELPEMRLRALTEDEERAYKQNDGSGAFIWDNLRRRGGNSRPSDRPKQWYPLYATLLPPRVELEPFPGAEEIWPIDPKGEQRIWRNNPDGARRDIATGNISVIQKAGRLEIVKKSLMPEGRKPKTLWADPRHSATSHGTKLLLDLIPRAGFSYPKSVHLVRECVDYWSTEDALILDHFAGSGTTGHAVINLNREDGGRRKFILVEMGDYFDTVLLPRIKKVTFTPEWKDGKPKRLATPEEAERSPRIVKVVRLESYEDALNNLETRRTDTQQLLLDAAEAQGSDGLKEQYILRYMLDVETRGSQSLLNVQAFTDPTAYKLKVKRPGSDESREVNVDLMETFNWLIGLTVRHIAAPQVFRAAFERDSEKRLRLKGRLKQIPHPDPLPEGEGERMWWFRTVTGTTPDGRRTLIIWRKLAGNPEQDNLVLDEWFRKHAYSTKDADFDLIYVNGGNNLPNVRRDDETWKVRLIEEDFHRLMFATEGV